MTSAKFDRKPFEGTFSNLVDDLFTDLPVFIKNEFNSLSKKDSVPVNVIETEDNYILEIAAPGFEKSDFKINLEKHVLTISAEKTVEEKKENEKVIRKEFRLQSFKRSFTLDDKIDATNIDATYINGVLKLNLPKKEVVKASATTINVK
jgi:HSP20 family protein